MVGTNGRSVNQLCDTAAEWEITADRRSGRILLDASVRG
jgi:hypothetical protein